MNWYLIDLPDFKACIQAPTKIHAVEFVLFTEECQNGIDCSSSDFNLIKSSGKIAPPIPSSSFKQVHSYSRGQGFTSHNKSDETDFSRNNKQQIIKIESTE